MGKQAGAFGPTSRQPFVMRICPAELAMLRALAAQTGTSAAKWVRAKVVESALAAGLAGGNKAAPNA